MSFETVTIAGGTGKVGHFIAEAFLEDGSYRIKILRRKSNEEDSNEMARSLASKGAEIVYVDYYKKDDLVKALQGTDVLISALNMDFVGGASYYDVQTPLLNAAKDASVKRFIPSEFGVKMKYRANPLTDNKKLFRDSVEKSGLEYTYIYFGVLQEEIFLCGFDIEEKKATFFGDGSKKIPTTSFSDFGKYIVESLRMPEARNSEITVAGANMSPFEYLEIFEKVTGSKWEVVVNRKVVDVIFLDRFMAAVAQEAEFEKLDNDKFSFAPRPVSEVIEELVSNFTLSYNISDITPSGTTYYDKKLMKFLGCYTYKDIDIAYFKTC
ncbi:unnamed protein product [Rhizophagus irregularis]|uniref:NmrA-like domain-containing protein n=1 Tax=Rhizophagus irregularis TaxID=588596 RepID=A0A916EKM5_9GLOM|nr:unnamed protein product [Rhizophagus irregularis]